MDQTTLGQRIAAKRKELGLTQSALGEQLGVSRQSIFKWESDAAIPEIDKLIALSRLFQVRLGWLLGVEEEPAPREEPTDFTPRERELLEQMSRQQTALPQWMRRLTIAAAACAAVSLVFSGIALWQSVQTKNRLDALTAQATEIQSYIQSILSYDTPLAKDFQYECTPALDLRSAQIHLDITPKAYREEEQWSLLVLRDGKTVANYECSYNGVYYQTDFSLEARNGYSFLLRAEDANGETRSQGLTCPVLERLEQGLEWPEGYTVTWKRAQLQNGFLQFTDLTLDIPLPWAFRNQANLWAQCDLVLSSGSGIELSRFDLMHRSAYSESINFSGADVSFTARSVVLPLTDLNTGDQLCLSLECKLNTGHLFRYNVETWDVTPEGISANRSEPRT